MTRFALTVAAGLLMGGLGAGTLASAAPAVPSAGLVAAGTVGTVAMRDRHHSTRAERRMRRAHQRRHGSPNARNPERPGYKQQIGGTTGGTRY